MKLRWRVLSQAEILNHADKGAVNVRRSEHHVVPCVLEWQDTHQTQKDFWTRVEVEIPRYLAELPTDETACGEKEQR